MDGVREMSAVRVRAVVDRFEGDHAVLLLGNRETASVIWPRALLPADVGAGVVLEVTLEIDSEETADAAEQIRRLLKDLEESE